MKLFRRISVILCSLVLAFGTMLFAACDPDGPSPGPGPDPGPGPSETTYYTVTFDLNYDGAKDITQKVESGKQATAEQVTRTNYDFDGWYIDEALTEKYDFGKAVTQDLTLYASWLESGVTYHTVTYHYNYQGAPADLVQRVRDGEFASEPAAPERSGYDFFGWYRDAACASKFYFSTAIITEDTEVYASWNALYIFEAENVNFEDLDGPGYSGSATGSDMILRDNGTMGASGGWYVSYLYRKGLALEFHIISDKDVKNAHFYVSLSAEEKDITLTSETYLFVVNNASQAYSPITITDVPGALGNEKKPFETFLISTSVSLKEGDNTIVLMTNNSISMGGTMSATAPMVDCIKISAAATLSWNKELGFPFENK